MGKGMTTGLVAIIALVGILGVGVITYYGGFQAGRVIRPPVGVTYEGHFDQFGESNVSGDHFSEYTKTTWIDDDVDIEGNATFESYGLTQVANESFTGNSSKYVNLNNDDLEPTVTVRNATDHSVISSSNYTMNYTDGGILVTSTWNTASMEITYNYMPTQDSHSRLGKIFFEIDGGQTRGGELELTWAETNVTSDNTIIREAEIWNEDDETVQELSMGKLQNEDKVEIQGLEEGEYYLYFTFDQNPFTPNVNSGTYEKVFDLDFTLDSPDAESDEPVEVEGFTVYAKTIAP